MAERVCLVSTEFTKVKLLRAFLRPDVEIQYDTEHILPSESSILISDANRVLDPKMCKQWDELCDFFASYAQEQYQANYDRIYLEKKLCDIENSNVNMIVVGSSYARFGLEDPLSGLINLSLPSQDIYYGIQLVKEAYKRKRHHQYV